MTNENNAKKTSLLEEIFMKPSHFQRNANEDGAARCNGRCAPGTCLPSL